MKPIKWPQLEKKEVHSWFRAFRDWDRRMALPGHGRAELATMRALVFDLLDWRSGRLTPGYGRIAEKADYCRARIAKALIRLRQLGVIAWARRCEKLTDDRGRFSIAQLTNAYFLMPPSQWTGYTPAPAHPAPPAPAPETWGATPPLPDLDCFALKRAFEKKGLTPDDWFEILAQAEMDAASRDPARAQAGRIMLATYGKSKRAPPTG
jgi:hypothetical protein